MQCGQLQITHCLVLQMSMHVLAGLHDGCNIVAETKAIELVVLEGRVRLWYQTIEIAVVCSQVNQHLEGDVILPGGIRRGRRERLKAREPRKVPANMSQKFIKTTGGWTMLYLFMILPLIGSCAFASSMIEKVFSLPCRAASTQTASESSSARRTT